MKFIQKVMSFALLMSSACIVNANIQAVGLMTNMAIIEVDGQRVTLRKGEVKQGVTLLESNSKEALVEYNGKRTRLSLGLSVASTYAKPATEEVRLYRENNGHYFARVKVNGKTIDALVDTGATNVAMSSDVAMKLGINYASGQKGQSSTAGGLVNSYSLRANHVQIGGIKKYGVMLTVIEGSFPEIPLLGMSFLNQMSMSEDGGVLTLTGK